MEGQKFKAAVTKAMLPEDFDKMGRALHQQEPCMEPECNNTQQDREAASNDAKLHTLGILLGTSYIVCHFPTSVNSSQISTAVTADLQSLPAAL